MRCLPLAYSKPRYARSDSGCTDHCEYFGNVSGSPSHVITYKCDGDRNIRGASSYAPNSPRAPPGKAPRLSVASNDPYPLLSAGTVGVVVVATDVEATLQASVIVARGLDGSSAKTWRIRSGHRTGGPQGPVVVEAQEETIAGLQSAAPEIRDYLEGFDVVFVLDTLVGPSLLKEHVYGVDRQQRGEWADLRRLCALFLPERPPQELLKHPRGRAGVTPNEAAAAASEVVKEVVEAVVRGGVRDGVWLLLELTDYLGRAGVADLRALSKAARHPALRGPHRPPEVRPTLQPPAVADAKRFIRSVVGATRVTPSQAPSVAGTPSDPAVCPIPTGMIARGFAEITAASPEGHGVQHRPQQQGYAEFVAEALCDGGAFAVEAGTGTGKTRGYLLPACEFLLANPGWRIVVATTTRNLQAQVVEELDRLRALRRYEHLRVLSLHGKSHYVCTRHLLRTYGELFVAGEGHRQERLAWLHLCSRSLRTDALLDGASAFYGDLRALKALVGGHRASRACYGKACRKGGLCAYSEQQAAARTTDIVVTNHHKLVHLGADVQHHAVCIVDEADAFPENARSALRKGLRRSSAASATHALSSIRQRSVRFFIRRFREAEWDFALEELFPRLRRIFSLTGRVNKEVLTLDAHLGPRPFPRKRWRALSRVHDIRRCLSSLEAHLAAAADELDAIAATLGKAERRRGDGQVKSDLRARASYLRRVASTVGTTPSGYGEREWLHLAQRDLRGWRLEMLPFVLSAAEPRPLCDFHTVLYTSATLYGGDGTAWLRRELGMSGDFDAERRIPPPFEYPETVRAAVAAYVPKYRYAEPGNDDDQTMRIEAAARTVAIVARELHGRTLVLCTSKSEMVAVAQAARTELAGEGIDVEVQAGDGAQGIERLRSHEGIVLIGVNRYWVGIDVPGPALSAVVVTRLPNANPNDPSVLHRRQHDGGEASAEHSRAMMALRLRQGFGRLIRSSGDRGLFLLLDPRVRNAHIARHSRASPSRSTYSMLRTSRLRPMTSYGGRGEPRRSSP